MKIRDRIKQKKSEQKGAEISAKRMGKCLHKFFKDFVNELHKSLHALGESGSEVSHFIPEPSNFSEVTGLPSDAKKAWLKNLERDQKFNQESDLYNILPREGRSIGTINGCVQGKNKI